MSSRASCRLGSRLYYEFTATVLGDDTAWESVADNVAAEVRRQGAPASASSVVATAQDDVGVVLVPKAPAEATLAQRVVHAPMREVAVPGVSVRSDVRNNSNTTSTNTTSTSINNNTHSNNVGNKNTSITMLGV